MAGAGIGVGWVDCCEEAEVLVVVAAVGCAVAEAVIVCVDVTVTGAWTGGLELAACVPHAAMPLNAVPTAAVATATRRLEVVIKKSPE